MTSPTDRFISGGQNWVQLVQQLQNSLHAQDSSIDKNFALIVDKKHAKLDNVGPIVLKKIKITDEHGEVNKKIINYMNQDRIVIRTHTGIAFSPSFATQLSKITNSPLQGRVSREQGSEEVSNNTIETPIQERAAPVMRTFVIRNANTPNEVEEFTAELESMDDETYASIFGLNFSGTETDDRVTGKEEKVEHRHKAPMRDITSAPRQTPQSSGKVANRDAAPTMLQQARNTESRRYQERRKESAAEDKEKRKEIRRDEEKREIRNEDIKKSEKIASLERADRNTKHRKIH